LYEVWRKELDSVELEKLPSDFYPKIADYMKHLKEESRMLDKRTAKASLLSKELRNVRRMVREITKTRYRKIVKKMASGEKLASEVLTTEEEKIFKDDSSFADSFKSLAINVLQGSLKDLDDVQKHGKGVVRFLKEVPAIIGSDMKAYGPFKAEDIATLPTENMKLLVKQGLAERVKTGQEV
jgi:DNA replication factor GINS